MFGYKKRDKNIFRLGSLINTERGNNSKTELYNKEYGFDNIPQTEIYYLPENRKEGKKDSGINSRRLFCSGPQKEYKNMSDASWGEMLNNMYTGSKVNDKLSDDQYNELRERNNRGFRTLKQIYYNHFKSLVSTYGKDPEKLTPVEFVEKYGIQKISEDAQCIQDSGMLQSNIPELFDDNNEQDKEYKMLYKYYIVYFNTLINSANIISAGNINQDYKPYEEEINSTFKMFMDSMAQDAQNSKDLILSDEERDNFNKYYKKRRKEGKKVNIGDSKKKAKRSSATDEQKANMREAIKGAGMMWG